MVLLQPQQQHTTSTTSRNAPVRIDAAAAATVFDVAGVDDAAGLDDADDAAGDDEGDDDLHG